MRKIVLTLGIEFASPPAMKANFFPRTLNGIDVNNHSTVFPTVLLVVAALFGWATNDSMLMGESNSSKGGKLTSQEIANAISKDFHDAERLAGSKVDVAVDKGLVTLSGTVRSVLDKRLASRIAKRTRGVQAVSNQIIVDAPIRPDDELQAEISHRLRVNGGVDEPQLALDISRGKVAVTGKVDSLAEKRIAEFVISSVPGVMEVDNQLTVGLPTERSDAELREEIQALIVHSVYLDDVVIQVDVRDSVAKLQGTVSTAAQRDQLERIAEVMGIVEVDMRGITVDPNLSDATERKRRFADVDDQSISQAIVRVFRVDPILHSHRQDIEMSVQSGVVELSGTVNRLPVKQRAERMAMDVIGVEHVRNQLQVDYPDSKPTDLEIIDQTQQTLRRSPYLDRQNIRVHCQAAHVSLYGIVDSQHKKQIAEWLAESVQGVVHVNNQLAVEQKWNPKSDDQIESDLHRKLKFALFDSSNNIQIQVEDGVAILRGEVDTWRQWQAAMDLALEAGAKQPHNLIRVRFHPPHGASRIYVPQ